MQWNNMIRPIVITCTIAIGLPSLAQAGSLYVYRDHQGTALLTNKKVTSSGYHQEKVTYYKDTNVHSYKNWGNSESAVLPSFSKSKDAYDSIIRGAAQQYGVAEGLVKAIMHTESSFNANARSPVGAQGLMQLMPATARRFNVANAYDATQNIYGGTKYLSWLLKRFNGNTSLALAAYNAGEGNVDKYNGIPPFRETQDYVRRVMSRYQNLYASGLALSSTDNPVKVVATSKNYTPSSTDLPRREIIALSDGNFTDRAARRTFANENAFTSSNITISD